MTYSGRVKRLWGSLSKAKLISVIGRHLAANSTAILAGTSIPWHSAYQRLPQGLPQSSCEFVESSLKRSVAGAHSNQAGLAIFTAQ
jgi:hypothetical protein